MIGNGHARSLPSTRRYVMNRKQLRLKNYDYSGNGAYFITICTKEKKPIFGPVGADSISARMVARTFLDTISRYPQVNAPIYTVMPNHFHAIIVIERADMESAPTISQIIQSFKRYSTVEYVKLVKDGTVPPFDEKIWQRSFYDHVIRNEGDYLDIWRYIEGNPGRWTEDRLFVAGDQ